MVKEKQLTWSALKKRTVYSEYTGVSLDIEQLAGGSGFKIPHGRKVVSDLDLYKVHALVRGLRFTLIDDFVDDIDAEVLLLERIYKEVLSGITATGFKKKGSVLVFKVFVQGGYSFESLDKVLQRGSQGVVGLALIDKDNQELACWYFDNDSLTRRYLRSSFFTDDFVVNEVQYLKRSCAGR